MRQSYRNSGPRLPATSENEPSTHSGKYVGWFVVRDALVEVDYVLCLHEHALCDDNSLWKERRVEPNSNSNARADKVAIVTAAGSGMGAACAWEQRPPRLHRELRNRRRDPRVDADAEAGFGRGDSEDGDVPALGGLRLHHGAEHPRGRRVDQIHMRRRTSYNAVKRKSNFAEHPF